MIKKYIILLLSLILWQCTFAQTKISLEECQQKANKNYPLIKRYELINRTEGLTLSNIGKTYLPQFSLNGTATYQSDVTKLPLDIGALGLGVDMPTLSKDQYKATIDVQQLIWDGGATKAQRKIASTNSEANVQEVNTMLYQIKDRVNDLYFGVLAIDEQLILLDLLTEDLQANKRRMESMFNNGLLMQSDLDLIEVELLNISQNRVEQEKLKESFIHLLSLYIGESISKETILLKPMPKNNNQLEIDRPELSYYHAMRQANEAQKSAIAAKNLPTLGLFAQGGYGKPGLNMLQDKFKLFAIAGVKLSWNFGNQYTNKNERLQLDINQSMIDVQEEVFLFNTKMQLAQEDAELSKIRMQLEKDDEIIKLYTRVKIASESKYKNGVYQTNDLIKDINAENRAKQQKALREMQYLQHRYKLSYIKGH